MVLRTAGPIIRSSVPPASTIYGRRPEQVRAWWNAIYHNRETQLGATATLVNFGDANNFGALDAATGTGMQYSATGLAPVWTPSEALSAFDTPFNLTLPSNWQGVIPTLALNGTDEYMTTPDAAYWSRALAAFSVGGWYNLSDVADTQRLMAKYTVAGDTREWILQVTAANLLQIFCFDENDAVTPNASIDTVADAVISNSAWHHLVGTSDGSANASGLNLYVDGALRASTDTDDANFVSMRDTASVVEFGRGDAGSYVTGRVAGGPCCPFFVQAALTLEQIVNMYRLERLALGV